MKFLSTLTLLCGIAMFAYAADPPENILKNGDFDLNLEGWHHWTHADAAALFQIEGKKAEPVVGKKLFMSRLARQASYGTSNSISNPLHWKKAPPIPTICGQKVKSREAS